MHRMLVNFKRLISEKQIHSMNSARTYFISERFVRPTNNKVFTDNSFRIIDNFYATNESFKNYEKIKSNNQKINMSLFKIFRHEEHHIKDNLEALKSEALELLNKPSIFELEMTAQTYGQILMLRGQYFSEDCLEVIAYIYEFDYQLNYPSIIDFM